MSGTFVTVACGSCGHEQTVFEKASTTVACAECGEVLAEPTGGLANLSGEVVDIVGER